MDEATAKAIVRQRRMFARVQKICDEKDYPYPPELCEYLMERVRGNRSSTTDSG